MGKRYRGFDNLVWLIGGDRNPDKAREDVDAVVRGIKEFDSRHLFTAHCHPENSAVDHYKDDGWLDLNDTYTYGIVHKKLLADYNGTPAMPYFLIETSYEGEHNASRCRSAGRLTGRCSAAPRQFLGNRPIWLFDPGWERALDATGSQDMARLLTLFRSRPGTSWRRTTSIRWC